MATIDYKQKIKDYMNSSEVDTLYKSMLNNLFPELKESEDDRIRKHLIGVVELYYGNTDEQEKKDCLAWLEKQGGQKPVDNMEQYIPKAAVLAEIERLVNNYDKALDYEAALEDVRDFIDHLEVKPKQECSEEDETVLNNLIYALANDRIGNNRDEYVNWLKSIRPQIQWKPCKQDILLLEKIANGKANPQDFQATLGALIGQLKKLLED